MVLTILEVLGSVAVGSAELVDGFLAAGYGASPAKIEYIIEKRRRERDRQTLALVGERRARQRYYNLISYLRRNHCIAEKTTHRGKLLSLNKLGVKKLAELKEQNIITLPDTRYTTKKGEAYVIVVFDVPEQEKRKRTWLRSALRNLGLKLVQKSVWIGKVKLPREFIDDLRKLNMLEYVEIFKAEKLSGHS